MTFESLTKLNDEKFSVEAKVVAAEPRLIFEGIIDLSDPGVVLTPYFTDVHDAIVETGYKEINFDISNLEYINSSGIKSIIKFIIKVLSVPPDKQYQVVIKFAPGKSWQPSSFKPVTLLAPKIVKMLPIG